MDDANADYMRLPLYRDGLARALHFDQADLDANRAGRLGVHQRHSQLRQVVKTWTIALVILVLAGVFAALAIRLVSDTGAALIGALAAAAFLFVAGYVGWYGIRLYLDVRADQVSSTEGFVNPTEKETDIATRAGATIPVWSYYWNVDGQRFMVIGKAYAALMPGRHRLYYLPRSRRVIGAEPL